MGEMKQLPYHSLVLLEKMYWKHRGRKLVDDGVLVHPKGYVPDWVKETGQTSRPITQKELEEFQQQVRQQQVELRLQEEQQRQKETRLEEEWRAQQQRKR